MELAIEATGLVKRYKAVLALGGIDLAVPPGTVLGLLGPNGAGKTTVVRLLTTLLKPDAGRATVAGVDVMADPAGVRRKIGLSGQYAAVDEYLTGYENLEMVGRLYHLGRARSRARAAELLSQFGLEEAGGRPARTYSGGMRRRLDLGRGRWSPNPRCCSSTSRRPVSTRRPGWTCGRSSPGWWLAAPPSCSRPSIWRRPTGLADEIVVVDHGLVIARGTSDELKQQVGGEAESS